MRFAIDLVAPKDVLFFLGIAKELERRRQTVYITTRDFNRMNLLTNHYYRSFNRYKLGFYGGDSLRNKLMASVQRMLELKEFTEKKKVDRFVCLCSPEACRVGFGFDKPVFNFCDIPEAVHVCKLTIPLSTKLFVPSPISKYSFLEYGISVEDIIEYPCLDPVAWLKNHQVSSFYDINLGLDPDKKTVVFTPSESQASYLRGKRDIVVDAVNKLVPILEDAQFVGIPRYEVSEFKKALPESINVEVINEIIDLPSLLADSDLFIGGGGTINIEASYFGVPVIACRPIQTLYEEILCQAGLSVKAHTVDEIIEEAIALLGTSNRIKAEKFYRNQYFPVEKIVDILVSDL